MFKCRQIVKLAQKDDYENGCEGEYMESVFQYDIKGTTLEMLKKQIVDFVGCDEQDIEVNPCDDDASRIDASRMENADGEEPTKSEYEAWKQGNETLYYVTYSFYFDETKPANFS